MKSPYWVLAGALFAGAAYANPYYGPGMGPMGPGPGMGPGMGPGPFAPRAMHAPAMAAPAAALRDGMDKLLAFLGSDERPTPEALAGFLDAEIAPFFDFEYMAESAGGRMFEELGADERQGMVAQIKQSFLGKMAEKLGGYDNQQVRFLPPRADAGGRTAQVSVAVLNPGSYPARLDFRLYRKGDSWLVYDVAANGQSAIVHYRTQLMRQMQQQRMQQMRERTPSVRPPMPQMPQRMMPMRPQPPR
ncbi:MAG: ABC transporter substrate-binding protein [Gammaproteobacteria bacterium]|nr:ABC transporter substrate-binding protein [Gammaproteobacteria bacterium]MCB1925143.1 ABC transporter substrate-binding protein [Gammaproteobacteria bacterium]